ncbi:MAG: LPD38 domain-containing protein, partial [Phycisphaeraceae bacterium]
ELGHAIHALVRDRAPDFLRNLGSHLTLLTRRPDSMASAQSVDEGFAEWVRLYLVDPGSIPREITKRLEASLQEHAPELLDALHDARLAYRAHTARDPDAKFSSYMRDRARPMPMREQAELLWHRFLYALSAGTVLRTRVHKKVFQAIRKQGLAVAREVDNQVRDTPADYQSAHQMTLHTPQEISRAIYGADHGPEGIRVVATGNDPFAHVFEGLDDAAEQMRFVTTFKLPRQASGGGRHGNYLYLTDYTVKDVIDAVGEKNWDEFEIYGWRKAALARFEAKGDRYPGLSEDQTPAVMRQRISEMEREHPDWPEQFERLNNYMDQLLLVSVLSGELTPQQAVTIAESQESYWPLPRSFARTPSKKSGKGAEPTAGIHRAYGSDIPFAHVLDAVQTRVKMAFESYYQNRAMLAIHEMGEQLSNMTQLPLEARAIGRRLMTPLELDWQKLAQMEEAEQQRTIASYLNTKAAQEMGLDSAEKLPPEATIDPEDVVISFPGEEIWRQVKPRAIRIVAPWNRGERQYFQIEDPLLYEFFARTRKPIPTLVAFAHMMNRVVKPWKRGITQTWPFAAWNVLSRDPSTAMLLGEGAESWLPLGHMARGLVNRLTGREAAAFSQSELLSKALDATASKAHQGRVEKLLRVLGEGIVVEGWSKMSPGQRLLEIPGQAMSTLLKPVDLLNFMLGSRAAAEFSEKLSREGAFIAAKRRGLSDEAAQAQYDFVTGNFGETSGEPTLAALFRAAGFFNPGVQILMQTYDRVANVDPGVRKQTGVKLGWLTALGAVTAALNFLLLDDDDKEHLRERSSENRMGYMNVKAPFFRGVRLRLPFDYGPPGAATSLGWNLMEGYLLDRGVEGKAVAKGVLARALAMPAMGDLFGPHIKAYMELESNYSSFFQEPIVPAWLQAAYPDNPELQVYASTPEWAQAVGRLLGTSPIKVEYGVRNALTSQFTDTLEAVEGAIQGKPVPADLADAPYFGRLFARESRGWRARSVQKLSDLDTEYQAINTTIRRLQESGDVDPERMRELREKRRELSRHHAATRQIGAVWRRVKHERKKENPDHERIAELERRMVEMARRHFGLDEGRDVARR